MNCGYSTVSGKRHQRRVLVTMAVYLMVLVAGAHIVRHDDPRGWHLYFWALMPAIPVIGSMVQMGRYLQKENDEYLRTVTVRSLLVGTAALLGILVVSDFLRSFTLAGALPPFTCFVVFFVAFAIAQGVQMLRDRVGGDD